MKNLAITMCKELYNTLKKYDIYPALTGGTLYKEGLRKDIDIIIYKGTSGGLLSLDEVIYEGVPISVGSSTLHEQFTSVGIEVIQDFGRVVKARWYNTDIDIIFPEAREGEYKPKEAQCLQNMR